MGVLKPLSPPIYIRQEATGTDHLISMTAIMTFYNNTVKLHNGPTHQSDQQK